MTGKSDEWVDALLANMYENDASSVARELVDKVFRPYLKVLDSNHAFGASSQDFADALENTTAMMVANFCYRVGNDIEQWADMGQEVVNNIAAVMSSDFAHRYAEVNNKGKENVVQFPSKH